MANKFSLLGKGGEKKDCLIELPDRAIGIGTDPNSCSIVYLQGKDDISAFHCQLVPNQGGWTIADYSDKGTWLNGKKMTPYQAYPLKHGDVFYLAKLENSFYFSVDTAGTGSNPGQTQNPQWQPQNINPGQTQNPQWQPQNVQRQVQSPQWQPQSPQWQPQSPQWQPQNPNQNPHATQPQEFGIKDKFLSYSGRLDRKTYIIRGFYLTAMQAVIWLLIGIIAALLGSISETTAVVLLLSALLALSIPGIMLSIRRLHDLDKSGWYNLLTIIPIANIYLLYMLLVKEGTHGVNRFGAEYHYQAPADSTQRNLEEKYLTFEGRLNRKPYILRVLCILGSAFAAAFLAALILTFLGAVEKDIELVAQVVTVPFTYAFPLLTIRRLHDLDKSGWFYLVTWIPVVNLIFIICLLCIKGTAGFNRFGADPLT